MKISSLLILVVTIGCTSPGVDILQVPASLPKFDVKINKGNVFDGYIFMKQIKSPGSQFMINELGEVVWYLLSDTVLHRPFTPYKESYLDMHSAEIVFEISYAGDTLNVWNLQDIAGGEYSFHHEVIKDINGNLVALVYKYMPSEDQNISDTLKIEGFIKVSPKGEKIWSWFLDQEIELRHNLDSAKIDFYGHSNSLCIDADGHYLISWKAFNQIWKINSIDGSIIWKYGVRDELTKNNWITGQHVIHRNLKGDYMVLDNGVNTTRAFAFKLGANKTFETTLTIDLPDSLYTTKQGSVYQFDENRFLFCSFQTKTIAITDRSGEVLWLAESDNRFYRAYYVDKSVLD